MKFVDKVIAVALPFLFGGDVIGTIGVNIYDPLLCIGGLVIMLISGAIITLAIWKEVNLI